MSNRKDDNGMNTNKKVPNPPLRNAIAQQFTAALDRRLGLVAGGNGKANAAECDEHMPEEFGELLALGEELAERDFSARGKINAVPGPEGLTGLAARFESSKRTGDVTRRRMRQERSGGGRIKRIGAFAAALTAAVILSVGFVQPSFAQEVLDRVLKTISFGHITITQMETPAGGFEIPEELRSQLFDKDGKEITEASQAEGGVFTADGLKVTGFANGKVVSEEEEAENIFLVRNPAELQQYTLFDVNLPDYVPPGFEFDRGVYYKDEDGTVRKSKYLTVYYKNNKGEQIYMEQRKADEETAYALSTDGTIEDAFVNGVPAAFINEKALDWEHDGILYCISAPKGMKDELFRMAESLQAKK